MTTGTVFASYDPILPEPEAEIAGPVAEPQRLLQTARDTLLQIVPRWLRGRVAGAYLSALAAPIDALTDALRDGVRARVPGFQPDALTMIGRDRRLRQGIHESADHFVERLPGWLEKHAQRGGPYALLEQVFEFYAPENFDVELRYHSGRRFEMAPDGTITRDVVVWSPPGPEEQWARWWLTYVWPDAIEDDGIWSDPGTWDDGGVWDADLTATEVRSIRLIPREWNTGHALGFVTLDSSGVGGIIITISAEST